MELIVNVDVRVHYCCRRRRRWCRGRRTDNADSIEAVTTASTAPFRPLSHAVVLFVLVVVEGVMDRQDGQKVCSFFDLG